KAAEGPWLEPGGACGAMWPALDLHRWRRARGTKSHNTGNRRCSSGAGRADQEAVSVLRGARHAGRAPQGQGCRSISAPSNSVVSGPAGRLWANLRERSFRRSSRAISWSGRLLACAVVLGGCYSWTTMRQAPAGSETLARASGDRPTTLACIGHTQIEGDSE